MYTQDGEVPQDRLLDLLLKLLEEEVLEEAEVLELPRLLRDEEVPPHTVPVKVVEPLTVLPEEKV